MLAIFRTSNLNAKLTPMVRFPNRTGLVCFINSNIHYKIHFFSNYAQFSPENCVFKYKGCNTHRKSDLWTE